MVVVVDADVDVASPPPSPPPGERLELGEADPSPPLHDDSDTRRIAAASSVGRGRRVRWGNVTAPSSPRAVRNA
jgi:hypothetical protein